MKDAKIHCAFFFFFAFPAAMVFAILPIVQSQPRHPYCSWYPFEVVTTDANIKLYTTAIYEAICMLTTALLNVSTDVFLYSLIAIVYYQIQLLKLRLTQIGWNETEFVGYSAYGRSDYLEQIVECISHHREINRLSCCVFSHSSFVFNIFNTLGLSQTTIVSSIRLFLCNLFSRLLCFR